MRQKVPIFYLVAVFLLTLIPHTFRSVYQIYENLLSRESLDVAVVKVAVSRPGLRLPEKRISKSRSD